jgi:hypothetical protein
MKIKKSILKRYNYTNQAIVQFSFFIKRLAFLIINVLSLQTVCGNVQFVL